MRPSALPGAPLDLVEIPVFASIFADMAIRLLTFRDIGCRLVKEPMVVSRAAHCSRDVPMGFLRSEGRKRAFAVA